MSVPFRWNFLAGLFAVGLIGAANLPSRITAEEDTKIPPGRAEPANRLAELAGQFEVVQTDVAGTQKVIPAEILGLTKGIRVEVRGNELRSGDKLLATLTTDFSATGLDLDKAVHVRRRPILLTLPNGKGLLCAYDTEPGQGIELVYPHTMGRVMAGTWIYFKRIEE